MTTHSTMTLSSLRKAFYDEYTEATTGWPAGLILEPDPSDQVKSVPPALAHRPYELARVAYQGRRDLFWVIPMVNGMDDAVLDLTAGRPILVPLLERVVNAMRDIRSGISS